MTHNPEKRLGVIVGSLRAASYSRRVARALIERAPASWASTIIEIGDLPLYNQDLDPDPPREWITFRDALKACDALLFVTPEYNRSVPGVLKNATDIGSRPAGENVFDGLPAAVVSVSPFAGGAMAANHALRQSFVYLNLAVMQQPEAYIHEADKLVDEQGQVADKKGDEKLRAFMAAFQRWIEQFDAHVSEPFEAFMKVREEVSNAYIQGESGPLTAISTDQEPATFFPPNGHHIIGAKAVIEANQSGAKAFKLGSSGRFEILASGSDRGLAWWSGIQHADACLEGKEERVPMKLRTTEIFRNEGGHWKLVHRHADFIDKDNPQR